MREKLLGKPIYAFFLEKVKKKELIRLLAYNLTLITQVVTTCKTASRFFTASKCGGAPTKSAS